MSANSLKGEKEEEKEDYVNEIDFFINYCCFRPLSFNVFVLRRV